MRQLDFHAQELTLIDRDLGQAALARPEVLRLMTIPGVDATVVLSIVAAVGDFTRFRTSEKLVSYFGLNPRSASPAGSRPVTAGSPRPGRRMPAGCWSRPPGRPRGRKGGAAPYSLAAVRAAERDLAAQSEAAYRTMVAAWQPSGPARKKAAGAAASKGTRLIQPGG